MKFEIIGRIPSKKNSVNIFVKNNRLFKMPSDRYKAWHRDASMQLKGMRFENCPLPKAEMKIGFWLPDRRLTDLTNKAESIMDLLVDNKILVDDNCSIVPEITLKYLGIDRAEPRAVVEILPIAI